jgi:prolyl-tRNA synthetase
MRGDHNLQEQKLADHAGASQIRPAVPEEIPEMLGASPGSLGAVGVKNLTIIADDALKGRKGMITGANRDDFHLRNTDVERDIDVDRFLDLREVGDGEPCARCGEPLELWKGIEVGHIFKLGTRYSEAMGAIVQDEKGRSLPIVMGCYGIGVERAMAAIVEASHDEKGIIWPVVVAPFEAVVTMLRADNPDVVDAAEGVYSQLTAAGVETLIDDRDERPGVKFADAELVGIPYRIAVGPKGVAAGTVELTTRRGMTTENVAMGEAAARVADLVNRQR